MHTPPSPSIDGPPEYRRWLPALVVGALVLAFVAAPWPMADKAHAAMHGLCAQNPLHMLSLGGQPLPFDARMTGVYLGLVAVVVTTAARGGMRRAGMPSRPLLALLGALGLAMAIDGTNSLFTDLGLPHGWAPTNTLRLITGTGAGLAMGTLFAYLVASTVWRRTRWTEPVVDRRDLALAGAIAVGLGLLAASGIGIAYVPVATLLVLAGAGTMASLVAMIVLLSTDRANRAEGLAGIGVAGGVGVALGLLVVAGLAAGRFALEAWAGLPTGPI